MPKFRRIQTIDPRKEGESFGRWLARVRTLTEGADGLPMSQAELAEHLGIAQESVSRFERGTSFPSAALADKLASFLGVPSKQLEAALDVERAERKLKDLDRLARQARRRAEEKLARAQASLTKFR